MSNLFINCLSPKRINHRTTGEPIIVGCGKCVCCTTLRSMQLTTKCKLESQCNKYTYFITLTYNNEFIPRCSLETVQGSKGLSTYVVSTCERIPDEFGLILNEVDYRYVQCRQLIEKCNLGDSSIGYVSIKDAQLFIKRLRKRIKNETIRYFICGEYGPKTLRPHLHALVWFNDEQTAENLENYVNQSWKFGFTDVSEVQKDCSSYVASYLNNYCSLPKVYQSGRCKPFSLHSQFLGEKIFQGKHEEVYQLSARDFITRSIQCNGSLSEFTLWRSIKSYYYPKCRGYDALTCYEREYLYTIYARFLTRKETHRQPSQLAKEIYDTCKCLDKNYCIDLPYDDVTAIAEYYEAKLHVKDNELCLQGTIEQYKKGVLDQCDFIRKFHELNNYRTYCLNYIYSDLRISHRFCTMVCNSMHPVEVSTKLKMIEHFYKELDLISLTKKFRHLEESVELGLFDIADYEQLNTDTFSISWFEDSQYYSIMKSYSLQNHDKRMKHKRANDYNRYWFRERQL